MAGRPPKERIDYAGWSVDIFDSDTKIDKLLDAHGWVGFGIYFYLCQRAYGSKGYYYPWGFADSATTARKMGGGVGSGTVEEAVGYCLQIGLFDKGLFDRWQILTSRGIQKRYYAVIADRACKSVIGEFWLLDKKDSPGLDYVTLKSNYQPENTNYDPPKLNYAPQKKSKVKKRKVNNTTPTPPEEKTGGGGGVGKLVEIWEKINARPLSPYECEEIPDLLDTYSAAWVEEAMKIAADNGSRNLGYVKAILQRWQTEGRDKPKEKGKPKAAEDHFPRLEDIYRAEMAEQAKEKAKMEAEGRAT